LAAGETLPPCEQFAFVFAWQVVVPSDPASDVALFWKSAESGTPTEIGRGPTGTATVGCGQLTAVNEATEDVAVLVDYLIGAAKG
jgi:hypothetical protein